MAEESRRSEQQPTRPWRRWLPLAIIVAAVVLAWLFDLHRFLSIQTIARNREALADFVAANRLLAIVIYAAAYVLTTVLVIPGAALLTILGGFQFGWLTAGLVTIFAATTGATLLFLAARSSFRDVLVRKGGNLVKKIATGFEEDAFNYLLFLRLVPVFPFFVVNIAPALTGIPVRVFVLATLLGIIPGTFAYAVLGAGLDSIIAAQMQAYEECVRTQGEVNCSYDLRPGSLLTPEILVAFVALGLVALIPPVLKRLRARRRG
jgi:uncharacterized membrane protein YdjX (TVP38/TMEM64 family)